MFIDPIKVDISLARCLRHVYAHITRSDVIFEKRMVGNYSIFHTNLEKLSHKRIVVIDTKAGDNRITKRKTFTIQTLCS